MRVVGRSAAAALVLTLAGCSSPTDSGQPSPNLGSVGDEGGDRAPRYVEVEATGKVVRIRNLTGEKIGYSAIEANTVFIAIIPPCSSPDACPTLKPHETVELSYEEITGYHEGATDAVVNAWNYVPDPQYGTRVGLMTQTRVEL